MTFTSTPLQRERMRESWAEPVSAAQTCGARWYALHVSSSQEHVVGQKLDDLKIEQYYPFTLHKSRDGKRSVEHHLMPGYVLASFDLAKRGPIVQMPQVVGILSVGHVAAEISSAEIENVRKMVRVSTEVTPCAFMQGQKVRIKWGPFAGVEGIVVRLADKKFRLVVSIEMMGRSISTSIDPASVEAMMAKAA